MTDTIEQAEESLASGDICVFECKQVISKLVDELKKEREINDSCASDYGEAVSNLMKANRQRDIMREAIVWALGYTDFEKPAWETKPFWWRKTLRKKAGLSHKDCLEISKP